MRWQSASVLSSDCSGGVTIARGDEPQKRLEKSADFAGYHVRPLFLVVTALIVVQTLLGAITAHYGVEGGGFYGIPPDKILPYAITRTWHTQVGIFWIATSWLATGLFI